MTTNNVGKTLGSDKEEEIAALKAKIEELENKKGITNDKQHIEKIDSDSYISVMSLLPYPLNLSTKEGGQGNIKRFTKFGEVKRILYRDLVDIMEANPSFLNSGFYYILDPRVIRFHGLEETYSRILSKDKIEEILSADSEKALELYNSANEEQQKIIIDIMVERLVKDPKSVSLMIIDAISRASGVKIMEKVEDTQTLLEQLGKKE